MNQYHVGSECCIHGSGIGLPLKKMPAPSKKRLPLVKEIRGVASGTWAARPELTCSGVAAAPPGLPLLRLRCFSCRSSPHGLPFLRPRRFPRRPCRGTFPGLRRKSFLLPQRLRLEQLPGRCRSLLLFLLHGRRLRL